MIFRQRSPSRDANRHPTVMPRIHPIPRIKDNSRLINMSKFLSIATCMVTWWPVQPVQRRLLFRAMGFGALSSSPKCKTSSSNTRSPEQANHHRNLQLRNRINSSSHSNNHNILSLTTSILMVTHRLSSRISRRINNINTALHRLVDINSNRAWRFSRVPCRAIFSSTIRMRHRLCKREQMGCRRITGTCRGYPTTHSHNRLRSCMSALVWRPRRSHHPPAASPACQVNGGRGLPKRRMR